MNFFSSCILGPGFDYYDFNHFINNKDVYAMIPFVQSLIQTLKTFTMSLIYGFFFIIVYPKFDISYILTEEFNQNNILLKFFYVNLSVLFTRCRYHFCWNMVDAGVTACGLNYNGKDKQGNHCWDRIRYVNTIKCETALSVQDKMANWNMPV